VKELEEEAATTRNRHYDTISELQQSARAIVRESETELAEAQATIAQYHERDRVMAERPAQHWEDALRIREDERNQLQATVTAQGEEISQWKEAHDAKVETAQNLRKELKAQAEEMGRLREALNIIEINLRAELLEHYPGRLTYTYERAEQALASGKETT